MRPNLRVLLGGLIIISAQMQKDMRRSCVIVSNPLKRNSTKKVKNKKSGGKQIKYSSTKPIKCKATNQFRNKSNI